MSTPAQATHVLPLDIGTAINELFNEVIIGTAYLSFAKSIAGATKSDPIILKVSPHFFDLTTHAHLECAQLYAAKLFDEHRDCASVPWLLEQARHRRGNFRNGTDAELDAAIKKCRGNLFGSGLGARLSQASKRQMARTPGQENYKRPCHICRKCQTNVEGTGRHFRWSRRNSQRHGRPAWSSGVPDRWK
jgi:hypothetical protein